MTDPVGLSLMVFAGLVLAAIIPPVLELWLDFLKRARRGDFR